MNDLLDYKEELPKSELFTWISLICSSAFLGLFFYLLGEYILAINPGGTLRLPLVMFKDVHQIVIVIGVVALFLSYIRKEPAT